MDKGQFQMLRCHAPGVQAILADTRHTFARHTHDQFGIGVIGRGAQKSVSGRGKVEAGPGDTITVNPGEVHDGTPIGDEGRAWNMLYFEPSVVAAAVQDIHQGRAPNYEFVRPVMSNARLARRFLALFSAMTDPVAGHATLLREEWLLMLVADASCMQATSGVRHPGAADIATAQRRMDDDPATPLTLGELAMDSGLSRFQLLRAFSRATGMTPHAYQVQRRVMLVRQLIARGTSLAEAAIASGFADQSHMTRIFVRKYGISPGMYASAHGA